MRLSDNAHALLCAFLHDPPDKALDIPGHIGRARRYATAALDAPVSDADILADPKLADQLASIFERLPMPVAGVGGERAVGADANGMFDVVHPLSATRARIAAGRLDEETIEKVLRGLTRGIDHADARFLAIWRLLPERLAQEWVPAALRLPADTRIPDHSIWHHADIAAALRAALDDGVEGYALLSFALGPVQPFIAAARTLRDLWTGSFVLSWLAFNALLPVVERLGPTAVIYPALRGTPLMDLWLSKQERLRQVVERPGEETRRTPSLPNRFLAVVPYGKDGATAKAIAHECTNAARKTWSELAHAVRQVLAEKLEGRFPGWDRRWQDQIEAFFDFRVSWLPVRHCDDQSLALLTGCKDFDDAWPEAARVRKMARAIPAGDRPGYDQEVAGRWSAYVDLSARSMEALRAIRHVPKNTTTREAESSPAKCSLMGSFEQMGPERLAESDEFWTVASDKWNVDGVRLRKRERLCAIALTKRFALPAMLAKEIGVDVRFPDIATLAAAPWFAEARRRTGFDHTKIKPWNGQWLHWAKRDQEEDEDACDQTTWQELTCARRKLGAPPAYYAVLSLDADRMGAWLKGDAGPSLEEAVHPRLVDYFRRLGRAEIRDGLSARRPMGPALHAAISEALTNFSSRIAPGVIARHDAELVYAGGDDLLALIPARNAVACAYELRLAFSGDPSVNAGADPGYYRIGQRDYLTMGEKASVSAGLAVVHHKEDLRRALDSARRALDQAKNSGRNAAALAICRRSGEHATTILPWESVGWFDALVDAFVKGASDRWAYQLRRVASTLCAPEIPVEAVRAEIRRLVDRADNATRAALAANDGRSAGDRLAGDYDRYCTDRNRIRAAPPASLLVDYATLCQSASFLARGRDA
jgi:CRISPR-associated protein Cmr2